MQISTDSVKKRTISKANIWLWGIFIIGLLLIAGAILDYALGMGAMFNLTLGDNLFEAIPITAIVLLVYLIPTIFACKKRNVAAIAVLNLYLGWTVIGWLAALV